MFDREIKAICPYCDKTITGKIYEKSGKVLIEKTCPRDGVFTDLLSSNAALFKERMSLLDHTSPNRCSMEKCRHGIFRCSDHIARKSPLAFIEITTRCNMNCPVCYVNANTKGQDMPLEDVRRIIDTIAEQDTNTHIVLIGGEPTIHKDFFKILEKISQKNLMKRTFIATNGITLANKEFCKKVQSAGIKKFYLGFDGTDREACYKIRGTYLAYDSVRKALQNIRENGKAWIIISVTAVKDLNVDNIPQTLDFAMDNSDIIKRVMIAPEAYCGRKTEREELLNMRLTGDCVEDFLRNTLKLKVVTVSISFFFALLRPLKSMGILDADSWMSATPSPFCGQMGLIWKDVQGNYHSIVDMLVKDAGNKVYELGRRANRFADSMELTRSKIDKTIAGRIAYKTLVYLYYIPKYLALFFLYLNKRSVLEALGIFFKTGFNVKKFKKTFFNKKVELNYLLCSDKYNFLWDKMPYCMTHHYRIHPDTEEVIKVPGCVVVPFREAIEKVASPQ